MTGFPCFALSLTPSSTAFAEGRWSAVAVWNVIYCVSESVFDLRNLNACLCLPQPHTLANVFKT